MRLKELERTIEGALPGEVELVDLQMIPHSTRIVKILIDKEGGVDVETCASVSSLVGNLIERGNLIKGKYFLEVSSPGIERPLKKSSDFKRFIGKDIKIKLHSELEGRKRFNGCLLSASDESLLLRQENGCETDISYSNIAKANLVWKFGGESVERRSD